MRSISLFEKIELDFKGTVFQYAICFFDIDNDGLNELCVCNTNGDLHVFKGIHSSKPWKINKAAGPVVVLCGGAVRDCDEKILLSLDKEGKCTLYEVFSEERAEKEELVNATISSASPNPDELRCIYQETLAPNPRCAILEDIDNDGVEELIVGFTDCFVRIYKWQNEDERESAILSSSSKKMLINSSNNEKERKNESARKNFIKKSSRDETEPWKHTLSFSLSSSKDSKLRDASAVSLSGSCRDSKDLAGSHVPFNYSTQGSFVMMRQYSLFSQVGSLAVCKTEDGMKQLIVSQPNGCYCIIEIFGKNFVFREYSETVFDSVGTTVPTPESYPTFNPFVSKHSRNYCYTNTEVIGGIKRRDEGTEAIGLSTLDGSFILLEDTSVGTMYPKSNWFPSEHRWFSMSKCDITNDGDDEIILCSMNGMTYMIDKEINVVSYNFNDHVVAFCAGSYSEPENGNVSSNCLCYVTLSGRIHIYYNVWISAMKVKCVHGALIEKLTQREDLRHILDDLKLESGEIDHQKIQSLVKKTWSEIY